MHGPLLPKNTAFADWLTATALGIAPGASRRSTTRSRLRRTRRRRGPRGWGSAGTNFRALTGGPGGGRSPPGRADVDIAGVGRGARRYAPYIAQNVESATRRPPDLDVLRPPRETGGLPPSPRCPKFGPPPRQAATTAGARVDPRSSNVGFTRTRAAAPFRGSPASAAASSPAAAAATSGMPQSTLVSGGATTLAIGWSS